MSIIDKFGIDDDSWEDNATEIEEMRKGTNIQRYYVTPKPDKDSDHHHRASSGIWSRYNI